MRPEAWVLLVLQLTLAVPAWAADVEAVRADVHALTDPVMEGRGAGSLGLQRAAEYLKTRLAALGLQPAGTAGYEEPFIAPNGTPLMNLVAALAPKEDALPGHVVLGAHYDHLGRVDDTVHWGADDNASGVAALLAAAQALVEADPPPQREIVFVLFSGEEIGLLGSRHHVQSSARPVADAVAMVNLDSVGRLRQGELLVFGTETAREFEKILLGVNHAFGLTVVPGRSGGNASDHVPFQESGVPSMHFFTGPHEDYHRPSDVAESVDMEGVARVADFTAELARYLGERRRPLTPGSASQPSGSVSKPAPSPTPQASPPARRRVSFGSIPDFKWDGEGVRISGVLPGSPAAEAGLQEGDIIVVFAGDDVVDLQSYSDTLKRHAPGDEAEVIYMRGAERRITTVRLVARR